jgi:ubiquinone/menaquinone biosynthesis C-methylase UbiE
MTRSAKALVGYWNRQAATYDRRMAGIERRLLADSRRWVCRRAHGSTLEIAVGTGANLGYYPDDVELTGVDWSEAMLRVAAGAAGRLGREITLQRADATALPFAERQFDTVVCTFACCCLPDERAALAEAVRVLRPGGALLLVDHVVATWLPLRVAQRVVELVSVPVQGEHYTRRPVTALGPLDVQVVDTERLAKGMIERVHAVRLAPDRHRD